MWVVTGIVPICNHEKWVKQAVLSLVQQTRPVDHLVVIDDSSEDRSLEMVKSLIENGKIVGTNVPCYVLKSPKRSGPSASRNAGIKYLWDKTDIFALLDSDDYYYPTKIEESLKQFDSNLAKVGVVYTDYDTINESTGLTLRQYKQAYSRELLLRECIINCDSLVSKRAIEKVGLFDESLRCVEDYDLWLRLTEHFMAIHISESMVGIRVGRHSSTDSESKDTWNKCYQKVFTKLNERLHSNRHA